MSNSKEIRRRISSIDNTGKITRAMEMVSAAKMKRATESVLQIRPFARSAWNILANLTRAFNKYESKLLEVREVKKVLVIAITSNRGLCGAFNSQIMKKIKHEIDNPESLKINRIGDEKIEPKDPNAELEVDFVIVGRKGEDLVLRLGNKIIASFPELTYLPDIENVRPLAKLIIEEYEKANYDKVVIAYTDYVSIVKQVPKIRQVLPVSKIDLEKQIIEMDYKKHDVELDEPGSEYKVEPNPEMVLKTIFPRLIEMQLYHAILESNASKESARMLAMKNATDAAKDMSADLTLVYNKIRQMKITQEIAEISAGSAAVE
jgi:F-type H+-transporting ATPase subunit gamma